MSHAAIKGKKTKDANFMPDPDGYQQAQKEMLEAEHKYWTLQDCENLLCAFANKAADHKWEIEDFVSDYDLVARSFQCGEYVYRIQHVLTGLWLPWVVPATLGQNAFVTGIFGSGLFNV